MCPAFYNFRLGCRLSIAGETDGSAERVLPRVVSDGLAYCQVPQSGYPGNVGLQTKEPLSD
jgi:hypothetical protein